TERLSGLGLPRAFFRGAFWFDRARRIFRFGVIFPAWFRWPRRGEHGFYFVRGEFTKRSGFGTFVADAADRDAAELHDGIADRVEHFSYLLVVSLKKRHLEPAVLVGRF